ncbi:MAG: hypothetical protein IPO95_12140 [Rhodanobacteraceae bacterium]|nr:hypothetical protein [Rhodanobacteraceae bacterium]MBL0039834.1 hypothetical protein [Xanthomonadales bacterium]MBP6079009.1 hypothetical protein [Xanthomonadales bacterium]MBP7622354.1 hypothetical protein [Xanthomonadales bacterium]
MRASDAVDAPSAELLLYLAEFADAEGKPEDPVRIERELPDDTTTTPHQHPETAPKSKTDDAASIPAKKAVDD